MRACYYILILLVLPFSMVAQPPPVHWLHNYGGSGDEGALALDGTSDGGFIVGGPTFSNNGQVNGQHGEADFWLIKVDSLGILQWQNCLGGSNADHLKDLKVTSDQGCIVVGSTRSDDGDVSGFHGYVDVWVVKLDSSGVLQWQRSLGGSYDDKGYSVALTDDSGYLISGTSASDDGDVTATYSGYNVWVIKLDSTGTIVWQNTYGGDGFEGGHSIAITSDGGSIVAGYSSSFNGDVTNLHGGRDFWILKLDPLGDLEWQKTYGGGQNEEAFSIIQTIDGSYMIVGYTESGSGDVVGHHGWYDIWALKVDSIGSILWQRCLGGSFNDDGYDVVQTSNQHFIVSGFTASNDGDLNSGHWAGDAWIIKLWNTSGGTAWQQFIGGSSSDYGNALLLEDDGSIMVAGTSISVDGDITSPFGGQDMTLTRLSYDAVGINEIDLLESIIFPNPCSDIAYFSYPIEMEGYTFRIMDNLGRLRFETTLDSRGSLELDVKEFSSGLYLAVVVRDGVHLSTAKMQVHH